MEELNMTRLSKSILALMLAATLGCGEKDDDTDTNTEPCNINQVDVFPAPDATKAYYRTSIEANFRPVADTGADITVTDSSGTAVAGSSAWRGNTLVFMPSAPLASGASYTTAVDYTCASGEKKSITANWMTSEVGAATDGNALVGNTYQLDLANARFVQPEGIGALLSQYLTVDVLVGISEVGSEIKMIGAIAEEGSDPLVQAACDPTIDFPAADFSANPYFAVSGDAFNINVDEYSVTIEDFSLSGDFAPDGSYIDGVTLIGSIDTRPLVPLLGDETAAEDAICILAATLNIQCEPCADGSGDFCLSLEADSISAPLVPSTTITPIVDPCELAECDCD
jgi:hypothetical protein